MNTTELVFNRKRLRQARIQAGLTQQALANLAGYALSSICKYESGERSPRPKRAQALAELLNKPPEWFFSFEGDTASR